MTRICYDSVTLSAIPANAQMVAGYEDGRYANMPAIRQRWPHAVHVSITVTGKTLLSPVCDCESGDLTPASAAAWAKRKIAAKQHPTIYCSLSLWPAVKRAVAEAGLHPDAVSYWIADYDNKPVIPAGAVAKQCKSTTKPNLDTSVVVDAPGWPGVDPKPPPKVVAKVPPKAPAPHPGPSSRQRARALLLHRLHLEHLAELLRRRRRR